MADTWLPGLPAIGGTIGDAFADLLLYADPAAANPSDRDLKITPHELHVLRSRKYSQFFDDLYTSGLIAQSSSGAGAQTNQSSASENNHPGCVDLQSGTTSTGAAGISTSNAYAFRAGGGRIKFIAWLKTPAALSDGTDRYSLFVGLSRTALTYAPNECIALRYRDDVNGGRWQLTCRNGGAESNVDTGVTVVAATWYRLEIDINAAASSVTATVNGTVSSAVTTNIPTAESFFAMEIVKALGTTNRVATADGYGWSQNFTTAR